MKKTWVLVALLSSLGALPARAAGPAGEFVVNSSPVTPQGSYSAYPVATMDERGEVLVVWGGGYFKPVGRRFAADGTPRGDDFAVGSGGYPYLGPFSAALDAKGFSVVWDEMAHHRPGLSVSRRFDAAKRPLTDVVRLDPAGTPVVASDPQGNSVMVRGTNEGVVGQRFDAAGHKTGPAFKVGQGGGPRVTMDAQGNATILWWSPQGIFGRRFTSTGHRLGPGFQVTKSRTAPSLSGNRGGGFVVAWATSHGIFARPYGPGGTPLRDLVRVTPPLPADGISVAMDAAGRFLVTWICCQGDPKPRVLGRFFEASGEPLGGEFRVSMKRGFPDTAVTSAAGPPGDFLVVWQRELTADAHRIMGRRLALGRREADP